MSREKGAKLHISASALVELKATLFSKQREVRSKEKKTHGADGGTLTTNTVSEKTSAIWRKPPKQKGVGRTAGRDAASLRDTQRSAEEEAELERSRKALEAKAALYDRLCGGEGVRRGGSESGDEEEETRYMVDFTRKIAEERKAQQSSPPSTTDKDPDVKEGVAEEVGEWAEYVDSFGRTRRCLKEDLPRMQEEESKRREERSVTPDLMSEDMAQERERRRWEREQAEELDTPVGPVHYEEMRQGEVRSHGVGYYAFSKDEEKRSEQLNILNKLREQTVHQREKKQKVQERRRALMDARLAKVRERKQLKQQVTEDEEEEEKKTTVEEVEGKGEGEGEAVDPIAAMINSELNQAREKAAKEVEEKEGDKTRPKKPYVRPWDKGKVMDPIRKRKKELEDERLPEFAPPSSYCKDNLPPKTAKLDLAESESGQNQPQAHRDGSWTTEGPVSNMVSDESHSGPPPPLPPQNQTVPQPTNIGPYPYPPPNMPFLNQYGGLLHHIGPPPPPPHGPIPAYTGGQPLYYYPYFHPPPPPSGVPPSQPQQ